eukprot:gene38698-52278_t
MPLDPAQRHQIEQDALTAAWEAERVAACDDAIALLREIADLRIETAAAIAPRHFGERDGPDFGGVAGGAELFEALAAQVAHGIHRRLEEFARIEFAAVRSRDLAEHRGHREPTVGYGTNPDHAEIELTYNHGIDHYELGTAYGHIAIEVPDAYAACAAIKAGGGNRVILGDSGEADFDSEGNVSKVFSLHNDDTQAGGFDLYDGIDNIEAHDGSDVVFGGGKGDTINIGSGTSVVFGDSGYVELDNHLPIIAYSTDT